MTNELKKCAADNRTLIVRLDEQRKRDPRRAEEYANMIATLEQATRDLLRETVH